MLVRALRPTTVVEIGVDEGGTLFIWTRASAPDAQLIGIDMRPSGRLGRWSPFRLARRSFARGHQRLHLLLARDSHAESTLEAVREVLDGAEIDFLFIDGDHSYEGVRRDFEMYGPLVRNGGIIALHDTWPAACPVGASHPNDGVVRFWHELVAEHETSEFTVRSPDCFGIGVVHVRHRNAQELLPGEAEQNRPRERRAREITERARAGRADRAVMRDQQHGGDERDQHPERAISDAARRSSSRMAGAVTDAASAPAISHSISPV